MRRLVLSTSLTACLMGYAAAQNAELFVGDTLFIPNYPEWRHSGFPEDELRDYFRFNEVSVSVRNIESPGEGNVVVDGQGLILNQNRLHISGDWINNSPARNPVVSSARPVSAWSQNYARTQGTFFFDNGVESYPFQTISPTGQTSTYNAVDVPRAQALRSENGAASTVFNNVALRGSSGFSLEKRLEAHNLIIDDVNQLDLSANREMHLRGQVSHTIVLNPTPGAVFNGPLRDGGYVSNLGNGRLVRVCGIAGEEYYFPVGSDLITATGCNIYKKRPIFVRPTVENRRYAVRLAYENPRNAGFICTFIDDTTMCDYNNKFFWYVEDSTRDNQNLVPFRFDAQFCHPPGQDGVFNALLNYDLQTNNCINTEARIVSGTGIARVSTWNDQVSRDLNEPVFILGALRPYEGFTRKPSGRLQSEKRTFGTRTIAVCDIDFEINPRNITSPAHQDLIVTWDFGDTLNNGSRDCYGNCLGQLSGPVSDPNVARPKKTFRPGRYVVTYTIYNPASESGACVDVRRDSIYCEPPLITDFPNAFTPNGDLHNAHFVFRLNEMDDVRFEVYDRWGIKVFSKEYNKDFPALEAVDLYQVQQFNKKELEQVIKDNFWDGTYNPEGLPHDPNRTPCPEGVYTYRLKFHLYRNGVKDPKEIVKTGTITLIR
ncbi:MAG: gliding motility-associated C-terminal domain-containing protein [Bacteroidia bacterium]|nr:gliding motility-associated C-terminal domain-containing protein [Bacteroidia bacterium]